MTVTLLTASSAPGALLRAARAPDTIAILLSTTYAYALTKLLGATRNPVQPSPFSPPASPSMSPASIRKSQEEEEGSKRSLMLQWLPVAGAMWASNRWIFQASLSPRLARERATFAQKSWWVGRVTLRPQRLQWLGVALMRTWSRLLWP